MRCVLPIVFFFLMPGKGELKKCKIIINLACIIKQKMKKTLNSD